MMTARAKVGGHEGVFIIDTGGGVSYITPAFAQTIGCKPWGQLAGFQMTGHRLDMSRCDNLVFEIEGRKLPLPITGVFDLMKFMPPNVPKVDGSIGLDLFANDAVTLSLSSKKLIVESRSSLSARIKHGKEVPIRIAREIGGVALTVFVGVKTSAGMAWMELDSGNGGANVIGKHLAALFNLDTSRKELQPVAFQLAGGVPVDGMARVNDTLIMDGNIGTRFLIKWDVTLDLANGKAWFAPAEVK